jgi:hypothetical protein
MFGVGHPFVRAAECRRRVLRQCAAVGCTLLVGILAGLAHNGWSWPLVGAAGVVLVTLLVILAGLRQRVREEAIDLLLTGYLNAPVSAIQVERRRLSSPRTRLALSRTYLTITQQARSGARLAPAARPLFHPWVVRDVEEELLAVAHALEAERVSVLTVARAERLITNGTSNLYGFDPGSLKSDLHRILDDLKDP